MSALFASLAGAAMSSVIELLETLGPDAGELNWLPPTVAILIGLGAASRRISVSDRRYRLELEQCAARLKEIESKLVGISQMTTTAAADAHVAKSEVAGARTAASTSQAVAEEARRLAEQVRTEVDAGGRSAEQARSEAARALAEANRAGRLSRETHAALTRERAAWQKLLEDLV